MIAATAFARTPTSAPSYVFHVGALLLNGIETDAAPRRYRVRKSVVTDHPFLVGDDFPAIAVIRLRDHRKWIFAERSVGFPNGFVDSDSHALARLAANERAQIRFFGHVLP